MYRLLAVISFALLPLAQGQGETARKKTTAEKTKSTATKAKSTDKSPGETSAKVIPDPQPPTEGPAAAKPKQQYGRPAIIGIEKLKEFETLPADRKKLIEGAIAVARDSPWLPYQFGGTEPKDGGFDCSGAMYFVMRKAGLEPPRSSAEQYLWVKDSGRLNEISNEVKSLDHPALKDLQPGDLLFWGGTYAPVDGRKVNITHIALFLGHEKDGRAVMINATDGRSYRGTKANGYGVYDFQLPREGARAVFMGYGTPPGIAEM
jgi:cell wall-associated NlpC family hydrolase